MTIQPIWPSHDASDGDRPDTASTRRDPPEWECYCGLGPACPMFHLMTPAQQVDCSRDKRRTAQAYYRNGM